MPATTSGDQSPESRGVYMPHFSSAMANGSSAFSSLTGSTSLAPPARVFADGAWTPAGRELNGVVMGLAVERPAVAGELSLVAGAAVADMSRPLSRPILLLLPPEVGPLPLIIDSKSELPEFEVVPKPSRSPPAVEDSLAASIPSRFEDGVSVALPTSSKSAVGGALEGASPARSNKSAGGAALLADSCFFASLATHGPAFIPAGGGGTSRPSVLLLIQLSRYHSAAGVLYRCKPLDAGTELTSKNFFSRELPPCSRMDSCFKFHESILVLRTLDTCVPSCLWYPAQVMHKKMPKETLDHSVSLLPQSKQT
mmetsp:Transcript_64905/g.155011  ORF Transcript_64905/g.155011 Transcript_64905/m.155011 type:complete len:311 (-) Transcript_64905:842-1774(-)